MVNKVKFGKRTSSTAAFTVNTALFQRKNDARFDTKIPNLTQKDKKRKNLLVNAKNTQIPITVNGNRVGTIVGANIVKANFKNPLKTPNTLPKSNQRKWRAEIQPTKGNFKGKRITIGGETGGRSTLPAIKKRARKVLG